MQSMQMSAILFKIVKEFIFKRKNWTRSILFSPVNYDDFSERFETKCFIAFDSNAKSFCNVLNFNLISFQNEKRVSFIRQNFWML